MRRLLVALALGVLAGCAALIDINDYDAPPADAGADVVDASDASDAACGPALTIEKLTSTPRAVHVVVDDTDVYYSHADPPRDSAILRCSKCGCDSPQQLAALSLAGGLVVDDKYVFYTDYTADAGSLNRLDKKTLEIQQVKNQTSPFGVAVDATYVYWTVIGGEDPLVDGIWRARKADLSEVTMITATHDDPDDIIPYGIAVDDTYVYFTTTPDLQDGNTMEPCAGNDAGPSHGTVRRVKKDVTQATDSDVLAMNQPCPVGLALDGANVYWLNLGAGMALNGSVWSVPKNAMTADAGQLLVDALGRPTDLAANSGRLTWTSPAYERIETCPAAGCAAASVVTLSSQEANPSGVAADDSGIYWVTLGTIENLFGDGVMKRAPSPP